MIPEEEEDWTTDPEILEFLRMMDEPGPWSEEYDKIFTRGGLSADEVNDFMKFQNKIKKRDEKKGE